MIDFTLTEEQLALQELAREFAEREIRPVVKEREALDDPSQRFPWDLVEAGSSLGLRTLGLPAEFGGAGADALAQCVVDEELAAGDVGVATIFSQTSRLARTLFRFCSPEQRSRHLVPVAENRRGLIALADAVADAASDGETGSGQGTRAERQGDGYRLNGHKLMVTLGAEASLIVVLADTTDGQPAAFLVSSPADGLRVGKVWNKVGQRLISSADLLLESCPATGADLLAEGDRAKELRDELARSAGLQAASLALGVGRAANEAAVSYARQRVQGGKPIIEHEAMGTMLADMATRLEMARTLTWKAAWAVDQQQPLDARLTDMAKVVATEAVLDVCRWAMEVHGGSGIMANLPIERYFRDASTLLHTDGTNQDHRLRIHRAIRDGR